MYQEFAVSHVPQIFDISDDNSDRNHSDDDEYENALVTFLSALR